VVKLVYFFSVKAFLILAIITAKIVCLGFLISHASEIAPIMWIFKVLSEFRLSLVSYMVFYLILGSVLNIKLILNLGLGSLSIFFIVEYQFF